MRLGFRFPPPGPQNKREGKRKVRTRKKPSKQTFVLYGTNSPDQTTIQKTHTIPWLCFWEKMSIMFLSSPQMVKATKAFLLYKARWGLFVGFCIQ